MRLINHELFKIFSQKVIYIAFIIFLLLLLMNHLSDIKANEDSGALQKVFSQFGGELTDEKVEWANQIWGKFETELEPDPLLFAKSRVAMDIRNAVKQKGYYEQQILSLENQINAISEKNSDRRFEKKAKQKELQTRKAVGYTDYILYQQGWQKTLLYLNEFGYFFAAALTIIGLSNLYSGEYTSRMDSLLFSSRYGRRKMVLAKMIASIIFCAAVVLLFSSINFLLIGFYYGLSGWNINLVNLHNIYSGTGFDGPVWLYFIKQQVYAILGCSTLGFFVMLLSSRTRSPIVPAFLGGIVFMLPILILFARIPSNILTNLVFHFFKYREFIQLDGLDMMFFNNFFGFPLIHANFIVFFMLAYLCVTAALIFYSIKRRQVT